MTEFVLGFVFLLFLALLVSIFGDRLSVLGALHGRWMGTVWDLLEDLGEFLWEMYAWIRGFVIQHLWWVVAVGSGSVGVLLVTWMVFGSIVDRAQADRAETSGVLNAGGLLDHAVAIDSHYRLRAVPDAQIADVVYQAPSRNGFDVRPARWEVEKSPPREDIAEADNDLPPRPDFSWRKWDRDLDDESWMNDPVPEPSRERVREPLLEATADRMAIVYGESLSSAVIDREIQQTLSRLPYSDWNRFDVADLRGLRDSGRFGGLETVPEATSSEVRDVLSSVEVIPGPGFTESDLKIEKFAEPEDGGNTLRIRIRITNLSRDNRSGLLVQEHLPFQARPVDMDHNGVYRDSVVSWVLNDILPRTSQTLSLLLDPAGERRIRSRTEVSALSAVTTRTDVRPRPQTQPRPRRRTGRPDVRMRMKQPPRTAGLLEPIHVPIEVINQGNAASGPVVVQVELPPGLDHHQLNETHLDRRVSRRINDLNAGQRSRFTLKIRATDPGIHDTTVQLLDQSGQLDIQYFTVRVPAAEETDQPEAPQPEPEPIPFPDASRRLP